MRQSLQRTEDSVTGFLVSDPGSSAALEETTSSLTSRKITTDLLLLHKSYLLLSLPVTSGEKMYISLLSVESNRSQPQILLPQYILEQMFHQGN